MLEMRKSVRSARSSLLRLNAGLSERNHQDEPKHQSNEQQNLPEAAKIDVFITLAAEPEPHVAETSAGYPSTRRRAIRQPRESVHRKCVHTEPLILRFVAADCRSNVETCCQP